jgi:hypothetical protein
MAKTSLRRVGRCIFSLCLAAGLTGCGGDSDSNGGVDPAVIAAAPQETKDICERTCTAADQVKAKSCGTTEFSSHSECYAQCVSRYQGHPKCKDDFDGSNNCLIDSGCNYQTQCVGQIIVAAACLQSGV